MSISKITYDVSGDDTSNFSDIVKVLFQIFCLVWNQQ